MMYDLIIFFLNEKLVLGTYFAEQCSKEAEIASKLLEHVVVCVPLL